MRDISKITYRGFPAGRVFRARGGEIECRGAVTCLSGDSGTPFDSQVHETGRLPSPKLAFTGSMEALAEPGDVLEQEGLSYIVLGCRHMRIGGTVVCTRALLERLAPDKEAEQ